MPTVRAMSGEEETARIAWPQRECLRKAIKAKYPTAAVATLTRCRRVRKTGPSCTGPESQPTSMRRGSGVKTTASRFSISVSSPSEAMNSVVRMAPRRSSGW